MVRGLQLYRILACILLTYLLGASGSHYFKGQDLEVIRKRSHLLTQSLPEGLLSKASLNLTIPLMRERKNADFLRVCYYRFSDPPPEKINGSLCTHLLGGFTSVINGTLYPGSPSDQKQYIAATNLKIRYPHLKVMLSVGGGGNNNGFSDAVSGKENRTKFIQSAVVLLKKYNFDGLDVDWEFPVWNDDVKADKPNFIYFLKEFKAVAKISSLVCNYSLLLSVAVAAPKTIVDVAYDIPEMAKYVDFINLMSYDYHDYFFYMPFTGHNSPLFNRSVEHAYFATLNTAWSALYWFRQGMPLSKIMVGLPLYGHTYRLLDPKFHSLDAPATGFGVGNGSISFPEVCAFLVEGGTRVFDAQSQVPYAYRDHDWIGYDDYDSIAAKTKWVKSNGFGGVMTFDLNCDDWQGICDGKTTFPLQQIVYDILTTH